MSSLKVEKRSQWMPQPQIPPCPSTSPLLLNCQIQSPPSPLRLVVGPSNTAMGPGESCKLPQWGLGQSLTRKEFGVLLLTLKSDMMCTNFTDLAYLRINDSVCHSGCIGPRSGWTPSMTVQPSLHTCMLRRGCTGISVTSVWNSVFNASLSSHFHTVVSFFWIRHMSMIIYDDISFGKSCSVAALKLSNYQCIMKK